MSYKEQLVDDDRHEGDYEESFVRENTTQIDCAEERKDLLKRQKIIRLKNEEFLKSIDLYRERLSKTEQIYWSTYSFLNQYHENPDLGFDLDSNPLDHFGSVIYRDLKLRSFKGRTFFVSELRFSETFDGIYTIWIMYGRNESDQKKRSFSNIEGMMNGLADLFRHHQIYTQDEKDCFDIIT